MPPHLTPHEREIIHSLYLTKKDTNASQNKRSDATAIMLEAEFGREISGRQVIRIISVLNKENPTDMRGLNTAAQRQENVELVENYQ